MAELALLGLTLLWGTTFSFVKEALDFTSPELFLAVRFGIATLAAGVIVLVRRQLRSPGIVRDGVILGLTMLGGFAFQTEGLRLTTPARSGFLTGLAVLIVPFIARFALGRRVPRAAWLGTFFAIVGTGIMSSPFADVGAGVRLGDFLTVACAVSYALQIVVTAERSARHPLALLTLIQLLVTFAGALLLAPLEPLRFDLTPKLAGILAYTALPMTLGAFFLQNWALRHTTAVRAALIFALEPVFAAAFSHVYLGEPLGPAVVIGGALIVGGVLYGELGPAGA